MSVEVRFCDPSNIYNFDLARMTPAESRDFHLKRIDLKRDEDPELRARKLILWIRVLLFYILVHGLLTICLICKTCTITALLCNLSGPLSIHDRPVFPFILFSGVPGYF